MPSSSMSGGGDAVTDDDDDHHHLAYDSSRYSSGHDDALRRQQQRQQRDPLLLRSLEEEADEHDDADTAEKGIEDDEADDEEEDSYDDDDDDDDLVDDLSVYDDDDEEEGSHDVVAADRLIRLRVKSFRDCSVAVKGTTTIYELKQVIVQALGKQAEGRYIRLICKGRLLAPDSASLGQDFVATVKSGDVIHAVLAAAGQRGGPQAAFARGSGSGGGGGGGGGGGMSRRMFRGAGIDASGVAVRPDPDDEDFTSESEDDVEEGGGGSRPRERLGFDRLRGGRGPNGGSFMGLALRRAEVSAIRAYFSRHVDRWIQRNPATAEAAAGTETDLVRRRLLQEDAWMQAQSPASEFRLNLAGAAWQQQQQPQLLFGRTPATTRGGSPNDAVWRTTGISASVGTDRDFMWGFMLGFFVGFLMLIWVWMPTVPHKQKLGILTGISFQLALGMLKGTGEGDDNDDNVLLEGN